MPLPSPHQGESQQDFVSRCMADSSMRSDFPKQEQRGVPPAVARRQNDRSAGARERRAGLTAARRRWHVKRPSLRYSRYRYWFVVLAGIAGGYCSDDAEQLLSSR
jgi:hypothetical protein